MSAVESENEKVVDKLVAFYNAHDARQFADLFSADATHGTLRSDTQQHGREEIYNRYIELFARFPLNKTEVVHRIAFEAFVIDHEKVKRGPESEPFDVVAIYTLKSGLITNLDFIRS